MKNEEWTAFETNAAFHGGVIIVLLLSLQQSSSIQVPFPVIPRDFQ